MTEFGFPGALLSLVRCPADSGTIRAAAGFPPESSIRDGEALCESCGARFSIRGGILDLMRDQPPPDAVSAREQAARDQSVRSSELDSDGPRPWSASDRMEIPSTLRRLDLPEGADLLDLGCGRGRITYHTLPRCRRVLAVDFSRRLLESFARRLAGRGNVGLVRADLTSLTLASGVFDRALSSQVLEHVPTTEGRRIFLSKVRNALKPGGRFVLTAYAQSLRRRLKGLPRDGVHPSGIYYHCFDRSELRRELARDFIIERIHPIMIEAPVLSTFHASPVWLSRVLESVPVLGSLGHLLLVQARRAD